MDGQDVSTVSAPFLATARHALALVRDRLGLDLCVLSLKAGQTYLVLDAVDPVFGVSAGPLGPWSQSLCSVMAGAPGPALITDVLAAPAYRAVTDRTGLPVRAYAGVALRDRSGALLGSLCAMGLTPAGDALLAQADLLRTVGTLLGDLLAQELAGSAARGERAPAQAVRKPSAPALQLPSPRRPHVDAACPTDELSVAEDATIVGLLRRVRRLLGLEAAFVSRLADGAQTFTYLDHDGPFPVQVGDRRPLASTLCQRVLDGTLPAVITDATRLPASREVDVVAAGLVRAYLTVPVELPDGSRYGTLCCLSAQPRPDLSADASAALSFAAYEVGRLLDGQQRRQRARQAGRQRLEALLARDGLQMALQPVVDLCSGRQIGFEALARFDDGRTPDQWFAEATGLGNGERLELAAVAQAFALARTGLPATPAFLAVNVSPAVLASQGLREQLGQLAAQTPALLPHLVLELTEHERVADYAALAAAVDPWRRRGLRLSIDDTGAGHSSLAHVLKLRPDLIKLDRQLVTALDTDPVRRSLVASLQSFCTGVGVGLIAEGVETAQEFAALQDLGVVLAQGYFLGRPALPALHQPH